MTRKFLLMAILLSVVAGTAGCGGGGGGTNQGSTYVITGTVLEKDTNTPISGAVVTIGGSTGMTDSNGHFSISMNMVPDVSTFTVNGDTAGPSVDHYYANWANLGNQWYEGTYPEPAKLPLPAITPGTTNVGTVVLMDQAVIPPVIEDVIHT
jgi:hypothetical protein